MYDTFIQNFAALMALFAFMVVLAGLGMVGSRLWDFWEHRNETPEERAARVMREADRRHKARWLNGEL